MSSYRPQSPDLSSYAPRSPSLATTIYRPQSPDLSGLGAPQFDPQQYPRSHLSPGFSSTYRGPTAPAFAATSMPAQAPLQPQYIQQFPQHNMASSPSMKQEDADYLPDAPSHRSRRQPQQHYPAMTANGPPLNPTQPMPLAPKSEPSDPTHGVVLKTSFPVARIKRIMQADEDIGKVAQVTPHVVSRALELFMIKLITASADQARGPSTAGGASKGPKRVLAQHMKAAIKADDTFDFLAEIIAKVPDAPTGKAKKEAGSDSDEVKPRKKGKKRKDSGDDF